MALDGNRLGDAIVDFMISVNPRLTGAHVTRARVRWRGIANCIVSEFVNNADVLPATHGAFNLNNPIGQLLNVPALGILDSFGFPCTGASTTGTTSAPEDIQGTGSIV